MRKEWDLNPRTQFPRLSVFKTDAISLSAILPFARPVGVEPTTYGFGDQRSTNWAKDAYKINIKEQNKKPEPLLTGSG